MPHPDPRSLSGEVGANTLVEADTRLQSTMQLRLQRTLTFPLQAASASTPRPCTPLQFVKIRESENLENPKAKCPEPEISETLQSLII